MPAAAATHTPTPVDAAASDRIVMDPRHDPRVEPRHDPRAAPFAPPPAAAPTPARITGSTAAPEAGPDSRAIRGRRPAARRSVPFEAERVDRTLMRVAPFPPARSPVPSGLDPVAKPDPGPPPGGTLTSGYIERPPRDEVPDIVVPADVPRVATAAPAAFTGPRGTMILRDRPRAEAAAPSAVQWPDSAPIDISAATPSEPAAPRAVVGRYEVLLRIARGGMGTVYLCRVTGEGGFRRLFALKVIRDHLSANPQYVAMLLQEARIASRLHHPNVVSIVDIGTLANQHYLVMDYVEGCTFSELLKAHPKSRPPHLIVPIVLDALTGLHAAHTLTEDDGQPAGLVHCDVSPQNMLVGANGICRLTDFGIARAADALSAHDTLARGKPGYLSPEQALGRPIDLRADIFSAGVVLWNALTGERLFDAEDTAETLQQVLDKPILPPSRCGLRPPACFDAICMRALQRDPQLRYASVEEMLTDLRKVAIANDCLAPSSEVGKWVTETFGHQIELRRQAAGIARKSVPSQLASTALATIAQAPGGHATAARREGSDTGANVAGASHTVMLRTDSIVEEGEPPISGGLKAAIFALSALAAAACLTVLVVRPEWLRGGVVDEAGTYRPWTPPPPEADPLRPPATDEAGQGSSGPDPASPTDGSDGDAAAGRGGPEDDEARAAEADAPPVAADPEPEPAPKAEPKPKPKPKPDPKPKPKPKADPKPDPKPKAEPKPTADPEPETKAEPPAVPDLGKLIDPLHNGVG
jgi:serine/threonine-protein kinase